MCTMLLAALQKGRIYVYDVISGPTEGTYVYDVVTDPIEGTYICARCC